MVGGERPDGQATAVHGAQDPNQRGGGGFSFGTLFRTHPTLEVRLAQLSKLEQQLEQPR